MKARCPEFTAKLEEKLLKGDVYDGKWLKEVRGLANESKASMQEAIKVSDSMLSAIENNEFDRLPQPVYVSGFIKSYCKYLGIEDTKTICDSFMSLYHQSHEKNPAKWTRKSN